MKRPFAWFELILSLALIGLTSMAGGAEPVGNEPLADVAQQLSCDRAYRLTCPLRQPGKVLTVILTVPSSQVSNAGNPNDPIGYAIGHCTLMFVVFNAGTVEDRGTLRVTQPIFRKIVATFVESEVFTLPEKQGGLEDYIKVSAMDSGLVVAERFDGATHRISRVYGESMPITYLANEMRKAVGKAAERPWADEAP